MSDLFDISRVYAQRGYVCLPVSVSLDEKGKKVNEFPSGGYKDRRFDRPEDWEGFTGIAINTAMSGIVVVDIDVAGGKDGFARLAEAGVVLPETPMTAVSQSGGQHRYYRACSVPVEQSSGALATDVDIRGDVSGIVFAYPTEVGNGGGKYTFDGPAVPVVDLPVFPETLARGLAGKRKRALPPPVSTPPEDLTQNQRDRLWRIVHSKLEDLEGAPAGQRYEATKHVMRLVGIGKTLGEVDEVADLIRVAFPGDEDQIEGSIMRAVASADPEVLPEDDIRGFWEQRPELSHIRDAALSGYAQPWAVLGCVLVQVLSEVPTNVRLSTGVGALSKSVPNLYSVLVGESGDGKSVAMGIAEDLWPTQARFYTPGSGQVIQDWFAPDELGVPTETSVIIHADELTQIGKAATTAGSTHVPVMCTAWAGGHLNSTTKSSKAVVNGGSYRCGMIGGIQPANAMMLLGENAVHTGLTQRLVWFDTRKDLPVALPAHPGPLHKHRPGEFPSVVSLCATAHVDIDRWQRQSKRDPLEKHAMWNRVKMAFALAAMNGCHSSIREDDWELSGIVMEHSSRMRQWAESEMRRAARDRRTRAKLTEIEATGDAQDVIIKRGVKRLIAYLEGRPEGGTFSDLRVALRYGSQRDAVDDIVQHMVETLVVAKNGEGRYQLA